MQPTCALSTLGCCSISWAASRSMAFRHSCRLITVVPSIQDFRGIAKILLDYEGGLFY